MRSQCRAARVRAACGACLLGCLLLAARAGSAAEDKPAAVRFSDDFAADSRKDYRIEGEVGWRKGALTLGTKAAVERRLPLGFTAEVLATVGWSGEKGDRDVLLALAADKEGAGVWLRRSGGKVVLGVFGPDSQEAALGEAGARAWEVRLDLRYGLVRARAWPRGTEEPAEWQVIRLAALTTWQPAMAVVFCPSGETALEGWQVRGEAGWRPEAEAARELARATDLNGKAGRLSQDGKYEEARLLYKEVLDIHRKALPALHPQFAVSLSNLGGRLWDLGQYPEARLLLQEALDINRKTLPPLHPELASALSNLSVLLQDMGKQEDARVLLQEALEIDRKVWPPLHPRLAPRLNNLGLLLQIMGKYDDARPLMQESLDIRRKTLPPNCTALRLGCHWSP
jgi:tetratricopeptide (TPR) repeat protein